MKRIGFVAMILSAALMTVATHAQNSKNDDKKQQEITVTGCLHRADAVGTSGSGNARSTDRNDRGSGSSAGGFVLDNARVGAAPGGGSGVTSLAPPGTGSTQNAERAGSTSASPAIAGATGKNGEYDNSLTNKYVLTGNMPELPRHVGQEVEISGRLQGADSTSQTMAGSTSKSGNGNTGSGAASGNGASMGSSPQMLEVRSMRMVASTCVIVK